MTIRARILLPMIILTIIASSAVLISNIAQFTAYVDSDIDILLNAASETAFNQMDIYESYANTTSTFIAECPTVIEALKTGDRELLINHIAVHNEAVVDFCTITNEHGIVLGRTHDPQAHGDDVSHTPSVKGALSGKLTSGKESRPIVRMSICSGAPVYDAEGNLVGTVVTGFRLDTNDFVDSLSSVFNCVATISLGNERMSTTLLSDDGTRAVGTTAPQSAVEKVFAGEIYSGRIPLMGKEAIVRYVPIRDVSITSSECFLSAII